MNWDTTVYRSGDVDLVSNNFTLRRSGLWSITANLRYVNNATGMRFVWISKTGEEATDRLSQSAVIEGTGTLGAGLTTTTIFRFTSGDTLAAYTFQSSGGALNTNTTEKGSNISFVWVGP